MKRAASDRELAYAFEKHRAQIEDQIDRLRQVFEILDKPARGKPCEAIKGIISEAET
jgi:ferritin-like metal-binding protein YciE